MKCPVCENEFKTTAYHDGGFMSEQSGECEVCCYGYNYAYGSTSEQFSFLELYHSYTFNNEVNEKYEKYRSAIIQMEREDFQKAVNKNDD
ncbi:hypothetical protein CSV63_07310 [Sporosarcina sp. P34]|uniref:hypothetical protein n=1 Tax=Sporosarcina sp. P34 TaxID=2048247 RepID=UPI000C16F9BA|nr:hypothetical protein [Sporosarcina sp. P34]PID15580.1 hypothetical protein CSV63_07310 [Sporosarcina sp. P34]